MIRLTWRVSAVFRHQRNVPAIDVGDLCGPLAHLGGGSGRHIVANTGKCPVSFLHLLEHALIGPLDVVAPQLPYVVAEVNGLLHSDQIGLDDPAQVRHGFEVFQSHHPLM